MSADHDVDGAGCQAGDHLSLLLGGQEARQHLDPDRKRLEALGERLDVLLGQQGRRAQNDDLLTIRSRFERGPQRHLGLAEADVAEHEPVHRLGPLHVGLDVSNRRQLVRSLLVRK